METTPKLRQQWIAWRSTCGRSVPMNIATLIRSTIGVGAADRRRLGPDRVDTGVRAAAVRQLLDAVVDIVFHEIDRLRAGVARKRETLGHRVDGDDPLGAQQEGAADGELADRAAAPDRDRVAALDVAEVRRHVAGREDIGQEQDLLVAQSPSGTLIGPTSANGTRRYSA